MLMDLLSESSGAETTTIGHGRPQTSIAAAADTAPGGAGLMAGLVTQPEWTPARTSVIAALGRPELLTQPGAATRTGRRGPTSSRRCWRVGVDRLVVHDIPMDRP